MGGPKNGNFPLLYVVKMSLRRWVGGSKNHKTPLRNIKMAPNSTTYEKLDLLSFVKDYLFRFHICVYKVYVGTEIT